VNLGGFMDELYKIAQEKGWLEKEADINKVSATRAEVEQAWGNLSSGQRDLIIPGWDKMLHGDLVNNIMNKWAPILNAWRESQMPEPSGKPEGEVEFGRPKIAPTKRGPSKALVEKVQNLLHSATKIPVSDPKGKFMGGPDGVWGKLSAKAWNEYTEYYTTPGGPVVVDPVAEDGSEFPRIEDVRYVFQNPKYQAPKAVAPTVPGPAPAGAIKGPVREYLESADDATVASNVVNELVVLADTLENMGAIRAAMVVDKQIMEYKKAIDKLYDVTGETGEQLINSAHPGGGPIVAPAAEEGGKVETVVEEQKKIIDKINKTPTGKYASTILRLIATANRLDSEGEVEAAKLVDKTIAELEGADPFVNRSATHGVVGSEDDITSIVKSAQSEEFIREWGVIKNLFNKMYEEVTSFSAGIGLGYVYRSSHPLYTGYRGSKPLIDLVGDNLSGTRWKKVVPKLLDRIIEFLDFGDKTFEYMDDAFLEDTAYSYTKLHENLIIGIKALKDNIRSGKVAPSKEEVAKEPSTVKEEYRQLLKQRSRKRIDEYVKSLKMFAQFIMNNDEALKEKFNNPGIADKLIDWVHNREYNVSKRKPGDPNYYKLTAKSIQNLNGYLNKLKKLVGVKADDTFVTSAARGDVPEIEIPGQKKKEKPTPPVKPKAPKKIYRRIRSDENIIRLQEALRSAEFSPGKIDGLWGPKTARAYNSFINKNPIVEKYLKPIANPNAQKHRNRLQGRDLALAIQIIEYMAKRVKREGILSITLSGGTKIPFYTVRDAKSFVEHIKEATSAKTVIPSAAGQILTELLHYTYDNEMNMESKEAGSVAKWRDRINRLIREFKGYASQAAGGQGGIISGKPGIGGEGRGYKYPWERSKGKEEVPSAPSTPSGRPAQVSETGEYKPLGRREGAGGDGTGTEKVDLKTPEGIRYAIDMLPDARWLSSPEFFTLKARAVMGVLSKRKKLIWYEEGNITEKYWRILDERIREITAALGELRDVIVNREPYRSKWGRTAYTDMIDTITAFYGELNYIGRKMEFTRSE
jgi:peptidoglycan hydrolase-like protein with peptidoglycan-binding domain